MSVFKMSLIALFIMSMTLIQTVSAQVVIRGPHYNPYPHPGPRPMPIPPQHRPMPVPAPYPAPRPMPGPSYPGGGYGYPQGQIVCTATDTGWEEHFGGHPSCGACLQSHPNCNETCEEMRTVCEVQGTDYTGRSQTYMAQGPDQYSAEMEARRQCEWDRNNSSCALTSCRQDNRTVSRRSCR